MRLSKRLFVVTEVLLILYNCGCELTKFTSGLKIAADVFGHYKYLFQLCVDTPMANERFLVDNLHNYINAFSKTTVGYAPQFTSNRKFFANMLNTAAFKNMLEKDVSTLQINFLEKLKFCDWSIMNQENLRQFYDREVDQTKL